MGPESDPRGRDDSTGTRVNPDQIVRSPESEDAARMLVAHETVSSEDPTRVEVSIPTPDDRPASVAGLGNTDDVSTLIEPPLSTDDVRTHIAHQAETRDEREPPAPEPPAIATGEFATRIAALQQRDASPYVHLQPGESFAGFEIEAELGRGEMGIVYRARRRALDRLEALKVIAPRYAAEPEYGARFMREASNAALTTHPNIVTVFDASEWDGVLYMAMQYVAGGNLRQRIIERGQLAPEDAADITRQISSALDAAHEAGLVHRDVKPGNILLGVGRDADHAYLSDFGVSRRADGPGDLTRPGTFVGAPYYAAPEQHRGEQVDGRTDVYALGCVLFEMLTGRVPFAGRTSTAVALAHCSDPPPLPSELGTGVPAEFDHVIAKAMAKAPDDRYQTAGALGAAAVAAAESVAEMEIGSGLVDEAPTEIVLDDEWDRTAVEDAEPESPIGYLTADADARPDDLDQSPQPPWYRRGSALTGLAALVAAGVLAGLIVGGVFGGGTTATSSTTPPPPPTTITTTTTTPPTHTQPPVIGPTSPSLQGAVAALTDYWNDIGNGKFAAAYNILASGSVPQAASEWIAQHQQANIQRIQFKPGSVSGTSGATAEVGIAELQTNDQSGCLNWSGSYRLAYTGGRWQIQGAPIQSQACS